MSTEKIYQEEHSLPTIVRDFYLQTNQSFEFDLSKWEVGQFRYCSILSEAMSSVGGFPSQIYLRKEMVMVWNILRQRNKEGNLFQWVVTGSPGVGKSLLLVLFCFYAAMVENVPVLLFRELQGEAKCSLAVPQYLFIQTAGSCNIVSKTKTN